MSQRCRTLGRMRAGKVLVVSLNPAIDCEWQVERVQWEEKNNILRERRWAGGKGSNVARWLRHLGAETELLVPLGGDTGDELAAYLASAGVATHIVPLRQSTRVNVIVSAQTGGQMRFNPLGPTILRSEWRKIVATVKAHCCDTVVFSGALPRGLPSNAYETLTKLVRKLGAEPILDCDGAAFSAAVKAAPTLVKPNEHELRRWWGEASFNLSKAVAALSETTGGWVVVSRGAEGALLWCSKQRIGFSATAPRATVKNTVGAGDAMLAGIIRRKQIGAPPEEWLRWGVAAGTAAVTGEGGALASLKMIREVAARVRPAGFP